MSRDFYTEFEAKFRGGRELVKKRLMAYVSIIENLHETTKVKAALDLGCGRGEWLEILIENGFEPTGVDINEYMLNDCRVKGFNVINTDAFTYLKSLPESSVAIISAFHFVEHINFEELHKYLEEIYRVLAPGGLILLETPNPENLIVASNTFYLDPSHNKPIPSDLLNFVVEYAGFSNVQTFGVNYSNLRSAKNYQYNIYHEISLDYSVVGRKKSEEIEFNTDYYGPELKYTSLNNVLEKLNSTDKERNEHLQLKIAHLENQIKEISEILPERLFNFLTKLLKLKDQIVSKLFRLNYKIKNKFYSEFSSDIKVGSGQRDNKFIYIDVTGLKDFNLGTGIQRVVRSIAYYLLQQTQEKCTVVPVYAANYGYKSLSSFSAKLGIETKVNNGDSAISPQAGDIFLALDFNVNAILRNASYLNKLQSGGVSIQYIVYDLLPVKMPYFFLPGVGHYHNKWLEQVAKADAVICISEHVKEDYLKWSNSAKISNNNQFVTSFRLGFNIENTSPPEELNNRFNVNKSFLMVGTVEPRKGHLQVLSAFQALWEKGFDWKLIIVGKKGWLCDSIVDNITDQEEFNNKLIWIQNCEDKELIQLYKSSDCLIAASYGEGFGLPLIEAASYGINILARDIPAFREVAGLHAEFFTSCDHTELQNEIIRWVKNYQENKVANSSGMPNITWEESAKELVKLIFIEK